MTHAIRDIIPTIVKRIDVRAMPISRADVLQRRVTLLT
jgi:hypothetical protein